LKARFATIKGSDGKNKSLMNSSGIPVSRWIDGVLEDKVNIDEPDNLRAMVFWGHAPISQTRMMEM
jgi:formate dehydrogenase major subunit